MHFGANVNVDPGSVCHRIPHFHLRYRVKFSQVAVLSYHHKSLLEPAWVALNLYSTLY